MNKVKPQGLQAGLQEWNEATTAHWMFQYKPAPTGNANEDSYNIEYGRKKID